MKKIFLLMILALSLTSCGWNSSQSDANIYWASGWETVGSDWQWNGSPTNDIDGHGRE